MAFALAAGFDKEVNEFVKLVREYEAATDDNDKSAKLRLALVSACRVLNAIDLQQLQGRLDEILRQSSAVANWQKEILGDEGHFECFLQNAEDGILRAIGIEQQARDRILSELRNLRELAEVVNPAKLWSRIVVSIGNLRRDVCQLVLV